MRLDAYSQTLFNGLSPLFLSTSILLLTQLLAACSSQATVDKYGRVVIHNFGYTKIIKPPTFPEGKELNATGARLVGLSTGEGLTIGYKSVEYMQIPTDCRVMIVVGNKAQLEHLINELKLVGNSDLCATIQLKQ